MVQADSIKIVLPDLRFPLRLTAAIFFAIFLLVVSCYAQENLSLSENTLIVEQAQDSEIFSFSKNVIVKGEAKGVLAFGGDVIIEGKVTGDVATIGGSIIQKEGAFIGGDVITFGGNYRSEAREPLRAEGKQTIIYAGYEEELREMMQHPSEIFAPQFSWSFLAQRLLSVLFWFLVSLALVTILPSAIGNAVARFRLSGLKIVGIGIAGIIFTTLTVMASLAYLPSYVGTVIGLVAFLVLVAAYVFGRVALHVIIGNLLQKTLFGDRNISESVKILSGTFALTVLLSLPYFWILSVFIVWVSSVGILLTVRSSNGWQKI